MGNIFSCVKPYSENKNAENKSQIITEKESPKIDENTTEICKETVPPKSILGENGTQIDNGRHVDCVTLRQSSNDELSSSHLVEKAKRLSSRLSCYVTHWDCSLENMGNEKDSNRDLVFKLSNCIDKGMDMGELADLVGRLEAAVAKIEKLGEVKIPPVPPRRMISLEAGPLTPTQERRQSRIWQLWGEQSTVPFIVAYDSLLSGPFKTFLDKSNAIGGDVASMAKLVDTAFRTQRAFLLTAAKSAKPSQTDLPKVLEATGKQIQEVISFREGKRTSPHFNHLSAVSESIPGLSWVAVEPAPAPYCRELMQAAVFYTNKVLKEYREKDKLHVEWVNSWTGVFTELGAYIKEYHTTGVTWNPNGGSSMDNLKSVPAAGGPPPPPPGGVPPPPPMVKLEPKKIEADATAQLFEDINKGLEITSKLKKRSALIEQTCGTLNSRAQGISRLSASASKKLKEKEQKMKEFNEKLTEIENNEVTPDMQTHKNANLREGPKPFTKTEAPVTKTAPVAAPVVKPPRMQLEGKKWFVEYQKNNQNIVISETSMEQCVYIYKCENSVIQVKGKLNSIILDSCKKTAVVFDSLVSSLEIVNCQSCKSQVMDSVATIAIEKTDGAMVYLSPNSLGVEIITAKSSEMNILVPTAGGDFDEQPVPEQFKTLIKDGKLVTSCTEKAGN